MPIYEYECTSCHHHFDLMQKISDTPIRQCPQCFEDTAVRLISAAGFQLKGSGWYVTDFKNKNKPAQKKESSSEGSSGTTTESTKVKGESD
ncbi:MULTISPECIES: FmdB family zinc ribbon protein [Legionella]|uniref:FmdB family transcriptional regulator n=1 Tax=Legionella quinlivanii TaxID=45073 RepID=A0A364LIK1_9GAMM|nr:MULTISPECIES: zinc ribbon domain-containing protein [Legionella]MCE3045039.1 zinc ribbon domain-containing protein [Legionella sp. 16cNR16C]RAP36245.1 FmdB family transcriptional regulator [Legionella quinlivanii]